MDGFNYKQYKMNKKAQYMTPSQHREYIEQLKKQMTPEQLKQHNKTMDDIYTSMDTHIYKTSIDKGSIFDMGAPNIEEQIPDDADITLELEYLFDANSEEILRELEVTKAIIKDNYGHVFTLPEIAKKAAEKIFEQDIIDEFINHKRNSRI